MLKPYNNEIREIALIFAHTGTKEDDGNRVYAVGAVIIDLDGRRRHYESFVRYPFLTAREHHHSHISKEVLMTAPMVDVVRVELAEFLKGSPFVLAFPQQDNISDLRKLCGSKRIVDLSFASEFFFPHADAYSPKRIWEFLKQKERDRISFTAPEMIDLSLDIVECICGTELNDESNPRAAAVRYFLGKSNTLFGKVWLHITRHFQNYFGGIFNPYHRRDTADWKQFLSQAKSNSGIDNENEPFRKVDLNALKPIYQGLSQSVKGFVFREAQIDYARHVASAINDGVVLTIEAGTGTGKTQGYLIPVMAFLDRNPSARVAISTYTKSLQDQIFQQEIQFLRENIKSYRSIPVALLKGKSNYLCAIKIDHLYDETWQGKRLLAWLYLVKLTYHFRESDGQQIGGRIRQYLDEGSLFYDLLRESSAKSGCTEKHHQCPAHIITAEARNARLIVTNHHKLALLGHDPLLTGLFKIFIVDEANHFEHAVRNAFGLEVNSRDVAGILDYLETTLKKVLTRAAGKQGQDIFAVMIEFQNLNREIYGFGQILKSIKSHDGNTRAFNELPANDRSFAGGHVSNNLQSILETIHRINEYLEWVQDENICRLLKIQPRTRERLKSAVADLTEQRDTLKLIGIRLTSQNNLTAYEVYVRHWALISQDVGVAVHIRNLYKDTNGIVYTSATLCQGGSFEPYKQVAGLDYPFFLDEEKSIIREFRFVSIASPFLQQTPEIIVPLDAVKADYKNKQAWIDSVKKILPELIINNKGRTLVLFSSYSDLKVVEERIGEMITAAGFPLLVQQSGQSTSYLCDEFRAIKESVLFGVDTFWYGVDFKGDTLTQVIITRIPFASPVDPLQMALKRTMPLEIYQNRYQYDTYIKMKQGMGRLIRCETDRGRIVVLDSRYRQFGNKVFTSNHTLNSVNAAVSLTPSSVITHTVPILLQELLQYTTHCGNCGADIQADNRCCPECGRTFKTSQSNGNIAKYEVVTGVSNDSGLDVIKTLKTNKSGPLSFQDKRTQQTELSISELRNQAQHIGNTGINKKWLIQLFNHQDYEVRRLACSAANKLRDKEIVMHIVPCLYAREPQVRQYALKAILSSRCTHLIEHISPIMNMEEKEYNIDLCTKILNKCKKWKTTLNSKMELIQNPTENNKELSPLPGIPEDVSKQQYPNEFLVGNGYKTFVCLASSRKYGGYCVAGKEWSKGAIGSWIRPVSNREAGELSTASIRMHNGAKAQLLDIITISAIRPVAHPYQRENVLIADHQEWRWNDKFPFTSLSRFCDDVESLWENGFHSSNGLNDRIPVDVAKEEIKSSLFLIKPEIFSLDVSMEFDKKKVRGKFNYKNVSYLLTITDPLIESLYISRNVGQYLFTANDLYLTISLGEPFKGFVYKLVAGVIAQNYQEDLNQITPK